MPKYSIIIPVWNNLEMTAECVASIERNTKDYELIIIDNGSSPAYAGPGKIIRNEKNEGYPVACNQGIKEATGEIIVLLNNDTVVTPKWIEYLEKHFDKFDIVGPMADSISGVQQVDPNDLDLNLGQDERAEMIHALKNGESEPWHRIVFVCVAMKRSVIESIGALDEQFSPGNFEDDDFCLRAIEAGFRVGYAKDVLIFHKGMATFKSSNIEYEKLLMTNFHKFQAKWPTARYELLKAKNEEAVGKKSDKGRPRVSLVMIVKNEEKGIAEAIKSCLNFVHEVVIMVDDSTTDKTEAIARKFTNKIYNFKWDDDFAGARNRAQKLALGEWVIFVDGHEYVSDVGELEKFLRAECDALICSVEMENGLIFRSPRIIKREVQFVGAVHEKPICKSEKFLPGFKIKHDRFQKQSLASSAERAKQRDDMIPRHMEAQYKKNPADIRASFHLGMHAMTLQKFGEAVKWFKRYLKYSRNKGERWFVHFQMLQCQLARAKFYRARLCIYAMEVESPGRWETVKQSGIIWFMIGKYQKAIEDLVETFFQNTGEQLYRPMPRDDAGTWNLVGESYFRLGNLDKAYIAFDQAAKQCADQKKKIFFQQRAMLMRDMVKAGEMKVGN